MTTVTEAKRIYDKEWRRKNSEMLRLRHREYYLKNSESIKKKRAGQSEKERQDRAAARRRKYAEDESYRCRVLERGRTSAYRSKANALRRKRWAEDPAYREKIRATNLRKRYHLTTDQYDKIRRNQNELCAICGCVPREWHVDHCHASGRVRGLLCEGCNRGIGFLRDRSEILYKAFMYLKSFEEANHVDDNGK